MHSNASFMKILNCVEQRSGMGPARAARAATAHVCCHLSVSYLPPSLGCSVGCASVCDLQPRQIRPTGCTSPVLPGRLAEHAEILRPWPSSRSAGPFRLSERVKASSSATKNSSPCREQMNAGLIDVGGSLPWKLNLVEQPVRLATELDLTLTSSRVLFRASVDAPSLPPTDTVDHTMCAIRALMPASAM